MKELFKVTRIGNTFTVSKSKCGHYYMALTLNGRRVTAWHRTTKQNILTNFRKGATA